MSESFCWTFCHLHRLGVKIPPIQEMLGLFSYQTIYGHPPLHATVSHQIQRNSEFGTKRNWEKLKLDHRYRSLSLVGLKKKCRKVLCGRKRVFVGIYFFSFGLNWFLSVVRLKSIVHPSSSVSGWGKLSCTLHICWENLEFRQTLHFLGTSLAEFYAESKMGILIHCKHDICEKNTSPRLFWWIISHTKSGPLATLSYFGQNGVTNEFFMSQYH